MDPQRVGQQAMLMVLVFIVLPARAQNPVSYQQVCDTLVNLGNCSNATNSSFTAVWCSARNPLLFPIPAASLGTRSRRQPYICESADWEAPCSALTKFLPFEVVSSVSNISGTLVPSYETLMVVANHNTSKSMLVSVLSAELEELFTVPSAGIVSQMSAAYDANDTETTFLAFGGVNKAAFLSFISYNHRQQPGINGTTLPLQFQMLFRGSAASKVFDAAQGGTWFVSPGKVSTYAMLVRNMFWRSRFTLYFFPFVGGKLDRAAVRAWIIILPSSPEDPSPNPSGCGNILDLQAILETSCAGVATWSTCPTRCATALSRFGASNDCAALLVQRLSASQRILLFEVLSNCPSVTSFVDQPPTAPPLRVEVTHSYAQCNSSGFGTFLDSSVPPSTTSQPTTTTQVPTNLFPSNLVPSSTPSTVEVPNLSNEVVDPQALLGQSSSTGGFGDNNCKQRRSIVALYTETTVHTLQYVDQIGQLTGSITSDGVWQVGRCPQTWDRSFSGLFLDPASRPARTCEEGTAPDGVNLFKLNDRIPVRTVIFGSDPGSTLPIASSSNPIQGDIALFPVFQPPIELSGNFSQAVWLSFTVSKYPGTAGGSQLHLWKLSEFDDLPADFDATTDPSIGVDYAADPMLRNAAPHCRYSGLWYYSFKLGTCVQREHHTPWSSDTARVLQLEARFRQVPQGSVSSAVSDIGGVCLASSRCMPGDTDCLETARQNIQRSVIQENLDVLYGAQHVLFLSTDQRTLEVVEGMELSGNCSQQQHNVSLLMTPSNSLSAVGNVEVMASSFNAQFIFAGVTRARWELSSYERLLAICDTLKTDPNNPFLQAYNTSCDVAREVRLQDFLQVASVCPPTLRCPRFQAEETAPFPDGVYTLFGFDANPCPAGHYCRSGVKNSCPIGFYCPSDSLALPVRCPQSTSQNVDCFASGLLEPKRTTNGTLSTAPYMPGIPAPPGMRQVFVSPPGSVQARRALEHCDQGQWCSLGRSAEEGDGLLCPKSTYCPNPSVLYPTICDGNGSCTMDSCSEISSCPAGSFREQLCPAGSYCTSVDGTHTECGLGSYCPNGTTLWAACPKGSYCPTPQQKLQCPPGFSCPLGSPEPIPCGSMAICPAGSDHPNSSIATALLFLLPCILLLVWFCVFQPFLKQRTEKQEESAYERRRRAMAAVIPATQLMRPAIVQTPPGEPGAQALPHQLTSRRPHKVPVLGPTMKEFQVNFRVENLGLNLKSNGKTILSGVTGDIRAGEITAVMGPSGSGKTTFITTLAGKAHYGTPVGTIRINGVERDLSHFKTITGFVPQEDIMIRNLTVWENLLVAARARLPSDWPDCRKVDLVIKVVDILGLRDVVHNKIGDEAKRGLSGGQRKRVNIALELVADPTILFLDEPTSGLDSTSALEVCKILRDVADLGLTVVAIIHQPRYEMFCLFHKVALLAKGGRVVYFGRPALANAYFQEEFGLHCPPQTNPACFFSDISSGVGLENAQGRTSPLSLKELCDHWHTNLAALSSRYCKRTPPTCSASGTITGNVDIGTPEANIHDVACANASVGLQASAEEAQVAPSEGCETKTISVPDLDGSCKPTMTFVAPTERKRPHDADEPPSEVVDSHSGTDVVGSEPTISFVAPAESSSPLVASELLDSSSPPNEAGSNPGSSHGESQQSIGGDDFTVLEELRVVEDQYSPPDQHALLELERTVLSIKRPGFCYLTRLFLRRALIQESRGKVAILLDNSIAFFCGLILSLTSTSEWNRPPPPVEVFGSCATEIVRPCRMALAAVGDVTLRRAQMVGLGVGLSAASSAMRVFGNEKIVYWREAGGLAQPWHTISYFMAKDLVKLPQVLLGGLMFSMGFLSVTSARMSLWDLFQVLTSLTYVSYGVTFLTTLIVPLNQAHLVALVFIFGSSLVAGAQPSLVEFEKWGPPVSWFPASSFMRYGIEALYVAEAREWAPVYQLMGLDMENFVSSSYGYHFDRFDYDIVVIIIYGVVLRFACVLAMLLVDRKKKH